MWRAAIYPVSWTLLSLCWVFFRETAFPPALLLIPAPWLVDFGAKLAGHPRQRGWIFRLFRWLNLAPSLPVFFGVLFFAPLLLPSFARHNDPSDLARASDFLGPGIKAEEVWYSEGKVFSGRAATYERIRFAPEAREQVRERLKQTASSQGCKFVNDVQLGEPESWFMKWDPASWPASGFECGGSDYDPGTYIALGSSGDSILIHYPGR
ncbi:MAG: hypothetical protein FJW30_05525 [Acidobacteria bacterium]|nr:hypothetical protein [Acidobacteriota bacterium]